MGTLATLIVSLTFLANLLIALLAYTNNPKSWTNKLLSFLALIFASWTVFNFFALSPGTESTRLFWVRIVMVVTAPMGVTVYLISEIFPQDKLTIGKKRLLLIGLVAASVATLGLSPWMFTRVKNLQGGNFELVPGWAIAVFAASHFTFTTWGFAIQLKRWLRSRGKLRRQWALFFFGDLLAVSLITLSNFVAVVFFNSLQYTFIGPTFTLFLAGFLAWAVIKHRLLDIRFVLIRLIGYSITLVLIAAWLTSFIYLYVTAYLGVPATLFQVFFLSLLTLAISFILRPAKRLSEKLTNAIFFKDRYNQTQLLEQLGKAINSTILLEELADRVMNLLATEMKLEFGLLILVRDKKIMWLKHAGSRLKTELDEQKISELISHAIATDDHMLIFDELSEGPSKAMMRELNAYVAVPLTNKEKLGLLLFGGKRSGEIYTTDDLNVIQIFTPGFVVAIGNALAYEEIRRFNITLQEEVDQATADLQIVNKKLVQLDKMKDEFVSLASHELRTPMTAIKSYTWMVLNNKAGDLTPKGREYLDVVYQSTERLIRLVNEMLDISRIESGRIQMKIESFDLVKLLTEIKEEFAARVAEKQLTLEAVCAEEAIPMTGDRGKILQIFENLIGNATKFTPARGKITVTASTINHQVTIAVADTGKGIKPEDLGKLFQKFGRLEQGSLTSIAESGTGLGLYLSKQYAQLHGGDITVASEFGKGSTFTVALPLNFTSASKQSTLGTSDKRSEISRQK